jgi:hypothetical protein
MKAWEKHRKLLNGEIELTLFEQAKRNLKNYDYDYFELLKVPKF